MSEISKQTQDSIDSGEYLKMYSGRFPQFCVNCGRSLVKERYFHHFDRSTGKEKFHTILRCPLFLIGYLFHTKWEFNSNGNEIIERY